MVGGEENCLRENVAAGGINRMREKYFAKRFLSIYSVCAHMAQLTFQLLILHGLNHAESFFC